MKLVHYKISKDSTLTYCGILFGDHHPVIIRTNYSCIGLPKGFGKCPACELVYKQNMIIRELSKDFE